MTERKHAHYFKDVSHLKEIDVYRVLELFNVTNPNIQHAVKKLLVAGGRGAGKDIEKDVREAVDSLNRYSQMRAEDCNANQVFEKAVVYSAGQSITFTPTGTEMFHAVPVNGFELKPDDLVLDTFRKPGEGGGFVSKPDTCVRIRHNPTGLSVEAKDDRSVHRNKVIAMRELTYLVSLTEWAHQKDKNDPSKVVGVA